MSRFWLVSLLILVIGCGLNATRNILPVPEPDTTILPRTKGIAATKYDISIAVVPLPDVKAVDGFGLLIVNESTHWISLKKEDCILIQRGEVKRPLSDAQISARLGGSYRPNMPTDLSIDIYEWRQSVNMRQSRDMGVVDKEDRQEKISIMGGTKQKVFLYFSTQGDTAPMQLIIPNIYNEATGQRTRFSFKFTIEKS